MNFLFGILLTVQIIICLAMIALILLQRSEGGALGMGGGPSGLVSARGAGNLLTRTTGILAFAFFTNCIALTFVGQQASKARSVIDQVGTQNVTVDPSKLAQPQAPAAQTEASRSSANAQPSLTQLPKPTAQVAPVPVTAPSARPVVSAPSPQDSLNSLKALDKKKDAIMSAPAARAPVKAPVAAAPSSAATPPAQVSPSPAAASKASATQ